MSVLARIEAQAAARPDALAVVDGDRALTYAALWAATGERAAQLREAGAGPGERVALALDKSIDWITSAIAAWRCGAAWMPLDPGLPEKRRAAMRALARPRITDTGTEFLCFPTQGIGRGDSTREAYVIFTSGSSGAPKGVVVTHAGLPSMLAAQVEAFDLRPGDRALWVLSPSFDASVSDVFTALTAGATLFVSRARTPEAVLSALHRHAITHVDLPPSLLPHLDPDRAPASLRAVVIGGEVCAEDAVRRWAARVRLVNVYGPTEATVCTSLGVCVPDRSHGARIGRPLPGVDYHLVEGELWIGGPQVARGYLGDGPHERFTSLEGARVYRTGDRVERLPDGEYVFLGRIDRQLKLRGRLVAPEEIEAALTEHPEVRAAAVQKRRLGARDALVGFFEGEASADALRAHLAERLPSWMVPAWLERVVALPRGATGKIDLAALADAPITTARGDELETPLEAQLAAMFEGALGVPVARDDDFFARGGDSFALVDLVARAAAAGLAVGPELVEAHPTVAGLARALDAEETSTMTLAALRAVARPSAALEAALARAPRPARPPRVALLTGATGFLGRRLHDALRARGLRVVSLVRRDTDLPDVVRGDVSLPGLGLAPETWAALTDAVDVVVHCAATVSLARSFAALRATNLDGTAEALRLALEAGASFHLASTLSVFVSTDRAERPAREDDDLSATREVYGGYAQSKVAAELLVRRAEGAIPITLHRLGLLTGDRATAAAPAHDWLSMLVRGLARLGVYPEDAAPALAFDVTPVDHAAEAMATLVLRARTDRALETFHLCAARPTSLAALVEAMRAEGARLEPAPREAIARTDRIDAPTRLALSRALGERDERRAMDLFQATGARFDRRRADAAGIVAPSPDPALLRRYVRRMLEAS